MYLFVFPHPCEQTIIALSFKSSLYTRNKSYTKPVLCLRSGKLGSKAGFFLKSGCADSTQTLSLAFLVDFSGVLQLKYTRVSLSATARLLGNAYLIGVTRTYTNKNEEQSKDFPEKYF